MMETDHHPAAHDVASPLRGSRQHGSRLQIVITLKPGILDAAGQAVRQGLLSLGYGDVGDVRVGRYIEIAVPEGFDAGQIEAMCERFLANPLIEEWRVGGAP